MVRLPKRRKHRIGSGAKQRFVPVAQLAADDKLAFVELDKQRLEVAGELGRGGERHHSNYPSMERLLPLRDFRL